MNQKRDLLRELTGCPDNSEAPFVLNSECILELVLNQSGSASERKSKMTKSQRWKTILAAIAAVMILTVGAYAANRRITSVFSSGPSISSPTYRTLPSEEQCRKDAGFVPILLEQFENGYAFLQGSVVANQFVDEENLPVEEYRSFSFLYEKGDDRVYFEQEHYTSEVTDRNLAQETRTVDGVGLNYHCSRYKVVPETYRPTEEEQKAQAEGSLSFGYGDPDVKIEEYKTQILYWQDGGRHCQLFQMNGALSANDLFEMATECIHAK